MPDLADLQHWFKDVLLKGATASLAPVRASNRLPPAVRVGVYVNGYRTRLVECLVKEFPILRTLLGKDVFELFARDYVERSPSRSYTLFDFGAGFPGYLERKRPAELGDIGGIPAALARIERAKAEVYRARGHESDPTPAETPFLLTLMPPPAVLRRPDTVRLLSLAYDFRDVLAAFAQGGDLPVPQVTPSLLAVARAGYRVDCHHLEQWQYDWLMALADEHAREPAPIPDRDPRLGSWLPEALQRGLVVAAPAGLAKTSSSDAAQSAEAGHSLPARAAPQIACDAAEKNPPPYAAALGSS